MNKDLSKAFSVNIKYFRKKQGLTQRELAQKLNYSEKAVAKWESGKALPTVDTMFELSNLFNVTIDSFLCSQEEVYFLGVDGGGTSTKFALSDKEGNVIKTYTGLGCNPIDLGWEKAADNLLNDMTEACCGISYRKIVVFCGVAGGLSSQSFKKVVAKLQDAGFRKVFYGSDTQNAVEISLGDEDGVVAIMGTGFCIIQRKNCINNILSGWGYLIDEGGSGYNIGRDGLSAYFSEIDGFGEKTLISKFVVERAKKENRELCSEIYNGGKKYVASFCKDVFDAYAKKDSVAERILKRNVEVASNLLEKTYKKFDKDVKIMLCGSVAVQSVFGKMIVESLKNKGINNVFINDKPPVYGALKLAMKTYYEDNNELNSKN